MSSNGTETDFTLLHSLLKPRLPFRLVVLVPCLLSFMQAPLYWFLLQEVPLIQEEMLALLFG
jgi:hypothetical protein